MTQIVCQILNSDTGLYIPYVLPCGMKMPQMFVNAGKDKVKLYDDALLEMKGVQLSYVKAHTDAAPMDGEIEWADACCPLEALR